MTEREKRFSRIGGLLLNILCDLFAKGGDYTVKKNLC